LAIVLRYVHDLPEATIAEAMNIARGTVASTLAAAQANLRSALSDSSDVSPAEITKEAFDA
jgi:DNA-directed RNA polymerase specialized sigma24 family protein